MFSGSPPRACVPSRGVEAPLSIRTSYNMFVFAARNFHDQCQCLLSRSAALIRCCGFRSLKLSQAKIEIWFADVFWLTPAGMCAVAGRGSSLVYPYKLQYVCFCCSQTQGKMRVYSSQYLPSPSYPSIVACCCRPLRLWLTHLPHRPTLEPPRRGPRARSSPPRQVAFSSTSDRSPSWRARATNASGAGTISTGC
jgi:hypothetical protein